MVEEKQYSMSIHEDGKHESLEKPDCADRVTFSLQTNKGQKKSCPLSVFIMTLSDDSFMGVYPTKHALSENYSLLLHVGLRHSHCQGLYSIQRLDTMHDEGIDH